jgi:hypothetical protein
MNEDTAKIYIDSPYAYKVGDKITIEGVRHYNIFKRFVRFFFKNAFEKTTPATVFTVINNVKGGTYLKLMRKDESE